MQVFQTAGDPPRRGKTILPKRGWMIKRSWALRNKEIEKRRSKEVL
jgi:hypothetical protein